MRTPMTSTSTPRDSAMSRVVRVPRFSATDPMVADRAGQGAPGSHPGEGYDQSTRVSVGVTGKGDPSMTETPAVPPELKPKPEAPDRNLALELVRVTEAAAMAAGRW